MKGGRVFRRGRKWWIAFYVSGHEYRESAGPTREIARRRLQRRRREVEAEEWLVTEDSLTVAQLLTGYETNLELRGKKSLASVRSHLKPLREAFGQLLARDLTTAEVESFQVRRVRLGKAQATVDRETEALLAAFNSARKRKLISRVPYLPLFRPDNRRTEFFEKREIEAVMSLLPDPLGDVTRFAYLSGWRKGEILPLLWESVDRYAREVRLWTSKSGKPRTLPLEGDLAPLIRRRWKAREFRKGSVAALSPYVFHREGRPIADFRRKWASACKHAEVPGKLFHDLRRTAVRNMIRAGVPQSVAMEITGHATDSVFRRYDITSDSDRRKALRATQLYLAQEESSDFGGEKTDEEADKKEKG